MWQKPIVHQGLNAFRMVRGSTQEEVETKARLQLAAWAERWKRKLEVEEARQKNLSRIAWRERKVDVDRSARAAALDRTREAEKALEILNTLLEATIANPHRFEWIRLNDLASFSKPAPVLPQLKYVPPEPLPTDHVFRYSQTHVDITLIDKLIPPLRRAKEAKAQAAENLRRDAANRQYMLAHDAWKSASDEIDKYNTLAKLTYGVAQAAWLREKQTFEEAQVAYNAGVADSRKRYLAKDPQSIAKFCNEVLSHSEYPDSFPRDSVVSFDPATEMLIVDFELPPEIGFPRLRQVKYIATRHEFQDVDLSDAEFRRLYDNVLYQICFRSLHELFQADEINVVGSIVFNGWVRAVDKATGADTHPCILTVQVKRTDFLALNLAQVDLKTCFRSLKGISGGRLTDFTPVRPVISLDKNDPRFVAAYAVADSLDDRTNLAAMDWLDFENLIRELFEKEFSKDGGEVKITQASRDGGVDAIAFDPDPIRGGKIVIQAKRYTNTVGVAAVRDLYGTVHNEGAIKGILVTTSDYGPDAYEFAKGKPLTLLSGSELLYLLERHGYHARIDLQDAKRLLNHP
jgi:restriction system protein